ncbi:response regulator transcription factor [Falsirhodobacter halotolerans]|uniref:response regulator transcription factor n=1 Tax=Falsirhodobacter halotolerans TaxID=1146892 RepID=UPI001FD47F10|nr:response regulator transcription factor [Falsirhodobacter halotolerans]MCJ8138397.1 response regulator transcription factor [Falsirhodobacter halotolerans]
MSEGLILLVEDDADFAATLKRSFEKRGFRVLTASGPDALPDVLAADTPTHAVVDLKLAGGSGLVCVDQLHRHSAEMLIVVLTGFASIATAVEAIKLGACHYLTKPSNTDDILDAFQRGSGDTGVAAATQPTTIKTLEWERIHETLVATDFNISETARRLGMHRRTLARKLEKWQVR